MGKYHCVKYHNFIKFRAKLYLLTIFPHQKIRWSFGILLNLRFWNACDSPNEVHLNLSIHCMKSVRIRSYSGPYFLAFALDKERYGVSLRIQSECGKIRTRLTPNTDTLYTMIARLEKINIALFVINKRLNQKEDQNV